MPSALQRTRSSRPGRPGPLRPEGGSDGLKRAPRQACPEDESSGAGCVRRLDDSRNSAIHTRCRVSLRSSSLREPRYPLLRVVRLCGSVPLQDVAVKLQADCSSPKKGVRAAAVRTARARGRAQPCDGLRRPYVVVRHRSGNDRRNDPSAGSPTETLLRLLLPLDGRVQRTSRLRGAANRATPPVRALHQHIQSVGATGGVYKGQGRNRRELMTRAY